MPGSRSSLGHRLPGWILQVCLSFLLAAVLLLFVFQPVRVEGFSMMPRLHNNERLFIDKMAWNFEPLRRGDVVVFHYPLDPRQDFIKRIIGMPGDRLAIRNGEVYIDGRRLREPYVPLQYRDGADYPEITVPPHAYFVLGDHRNRSSDSRIWGCLPAHDIFGRAVWAYWPVRDAGLVH